MYRIGVFSELTGIPVKTLRYYDEIGVLIPSEIDQFTGYRSYSEEQINEAYYILMLKGLDFTLEEIIRYKNNMDYNVLEAKKDEINYKIQTDLEKVSKIEELQRTTFKNNRPKVRRIAC